MLRIHGVVSLSDTFLTRMLTRFLRSSLYVFLGGSPAFLGQTTQGVFDFRFYSILYAIRFLKLWTKVEINQTFRAAQQVAEHLPSCANLHEIS